jgi:hypothetical protein
MKGWTKAREIKEGCLSRIPDDEPIFVLRARDLSASILVMEWARMNAKTIPKSKFDDAVATANAMDKWPGRKNPD